MNPQGNRAEQAMTLIARLENLVRERTKERDEWKRSFLVAISVGRPVPFWVGVMVGGFVVGLILMIKEIVR